MIGVSRAYKESSNCRMEAQYALQKKKALIPLLLTQGYEADGWLGLLLGTSMWYGFYGDALSSASVFESRMDGLCREIGVRGRADALVAASPGTTQSLLESGVASDGSGEMADGDDEEALRLELQGLRLKQLRERATIAGLDEDALGDALDADNPKSALIGLLVEHRRSMGPVEEMLGALVDGGDACVEMLTCALEHAMEVLEKLSVSSPRKSRRSLHDVSDRVECVLDSMDVEWCEGVSRCGRDEMHRLSGLLVTVRGLTSSSGASDACGAVTAVLECLDRCGSVVLQSMAVLSSADCAAGSAGVVSALESLRCLSEERLDAVCSDEAAVYEVVKDRLREMDACVGGEVVSGCMALHTLGCRNGIALCGSVDVIELSSGLLSKWLEGVSCGGEDYLAGAALGAVFMLSGWECCPKMSAETRGPVEAAFEKAWGKTLFPIVAKAFTEQRVREVFASSMKAGILSHEDISLACGWCCVIFFLGYMHPGTLVAANESGVFSSALALHRRVEPSPLAAEWWLGTCDVVDVTSARICYALSTTFVLAKRLPSVTQASWWSELLDHAIRLVKMNASAGLSGRETMNVNPFAHSLSVVEVAAQEESQHEMLLGSGVADALEYAILHDFSYGGINIIAAYASGAAVALFGRNEGGKVLRREAVHAVLDRMYDSFRPGSLFSSAPAKSVLPSVARIAIMATSDANKKHMLEFEPLIGMLLECLIIDDDNHRKGQDGADALQEASAGVLHELSLYGPGASALRSHAGAVSTLHKLCEVGTKVSRERGAAALFELDEDVRRGKQGSGGTDDGKGTGLTSAAGGGGKAPPHVMASYNWDHQEVILRVVSSLQDRGYLVWVDTEQMKGATVDTMALAVEGSEVVMIGVSRAYKESSNCRMEAQYALQKKKALIPLMLTQGYEADGWLGLLLGTSMWYGFYGDALSSASVFESRMDGLCREIGVRGRADAAVASELPPSGVVTESVGAGNATTLVQELRALKLTALHKRVVSLGLDADAVEHAMDQPDPSAALVALIVANSPPEPPPSTSLAREELEAMRVRDLVQRAQANGLGEAALDAMDADDPRGELVELLLERG
eukprot:COSAG06_NODE_259_length_18912_cov_53.912614_18_plen_1085_part_00